MPLTLVEILEKQREFDKRHSGTSEFFEEIDRNNVQALEHLIVCLVGEIGEFSNIVKKVKRGDFSFDLVKANLDEELVDIFIYLMKIANQFNTDLECGFLKKLEKNKERFKKYEK